MATCGCGCGSDIPDGNRYRRGHHWKVKREAKGITDTKVCERCGRTYSRDDLVTRQSNSHWAERRFCGEDCRRADRAEASAAEAEENSPSWKGDDAKAQAGRKRARRLYPEVQPCVECGEPGERHHVDGNTLNNEPENIEWLCRLHHIGVEERNSYKRKPMTAERLERRRAQAAARARRHRARKRAQQ